MRHWVQYIMADVIKKKKYIQYKKMDVQVYTVVCRVVVYLYKWKIFEGGVGEIRKAENWVEN